MKILVILPDSPFPWDNAPARYHGPILRALDGLGHDVTVFSTWDQKASPGSPSGYFANTALKFKFFNPPLPKPYYERKIRSLLRPGWELAESEFGRCIRQEARGSYDVILAEHPDSGRIVEGDPRLILSSHCFRHVDLLPCGKSETLREKMERWQARRSELSVLRKANVIRVLSRRMERIAKAVGVRGRINVVPICLDLSLYEPVRPPQTPVVGVLGSMFWPPSRRAAEHFLENIVPRLRTCHPGVRFLVGGWRAKEFLASKIHADDVELLDSFQLPRDAFARLSALVYAPPTGTGMKVKVLEAMAYGVPAVVNDEGFEGLDADPEPSVRLTRSDDEIVENVKELISDTRARDRAVESGRECIKRSFSPATVSKALESLFYQHTQRDS